VTGGSWVPGADGSLFDLHNLPYGVFSRSGAGSGGSGRRPGVAIGDQVLDLAGAAGAGLLGAAGPDWFGREDLGPFLAAGRPAWRSVRERLTELLGEPANRDPVLPYLVPRAAVDLHLPWQVGDYVDFYSSIHHAENLGRMFRPDAEPLTPNWRHLPIGYHGRSGTVAVSGTPVVRPCGQRRPPDAAAPLFGPSARLDIEAEVGFVVGAPSALGAPVPVTEFAEHVFGVVLVNDWSARDLQAWEYVPLGPFLGKSFLTSVSPWVVPLDALAAARVAPPPQDPEPLPYLRGSEPWGLDLALQVTLNGHVVSRPPFATMYWTPAQQLAHMTVNGASIRTGDLYASGTVSGPEPDQRGSLIELSWNGTEPLELADGSTRTFLADGDTVTIAATAPGPGGTRIGFGEVTGTVLPAAR
jgi:fumarylacetoacetase